MFQFNRKYMFMATGAGLVVTAVVQTIYSMITHQAMSATLPGLVLSLGLFVVVTAFAAVHFSKRATEDADAFISLYDDLCDPQSFVDQGKLLASGMTVPYTASSSWFMSYYAQALLDVGVTQNAREIERAMYDSIAETSKTEEQAQIITNLVPLSLKVLGPEETLPIIETGIDLLNQGPQLKLAPVIAYLENQRIIVDARIFGKADKLLPFYASVRADSSVPLRVRVEHTWDEARLHYQLGNVPTEKECLEYVTRFGNRLALVKAAKERLAVIHSSSEVVSAQESV